MVSWMDNWSSGMESWIKLDWNIIYGNLWQCNGHGYGGPKCHPKTSDKKRRGEIYQDSGFEWCSNDMALKVLHARVKGQQQHMKPRVLARANLTMMWLKRDMFHPYYHYSNNIQISFSMTGVYQKNRSFLGEPICPSAYLTTNPIPNPFPLLPPSSGLVSWWIQPSFWSQHLFCKQSGQQ